MGCCGADIIFSLNVSRTSLLNFCCLKHSSTRSAPEGSSSVLVSELALCCGCVASTCLSCSSSSLSQGFISPFPDERPWGTLLLLLLFEAPFISLPPDRNSEEPDVDGEVDDVGGVFLPVLLSSLAEVLLV